jgi:hypothetical protein
MYPINLGIAPTVVVGTIGFHCSNREILNPAVKLGVQEAAEHGLLPVVSITVMVMSTAGPAVMMTASPAPSIMMTPAAAAHMTVTMAMSAFHEYDGVAGVGGKGACRNPRHR